ncbi:MAG: hypothetical protein QME81_14105 [bacterium]|nr:hypothetical protein [bacterium]
MNLEKLDKKVLAIITITILVGITMLVVRPTPGWAALIVVAGIAPITAIVILEDFF